MPVRRVVGGWLLLAFVMSVNGVVREVVLVPWAKRRLADVLSAALGILLILGLSRPVLRGADPSRASPSKIAATWTSLTVAFEFGFGHYVDRKSWGELAGNYALWRGRLWPIVLATVPLAPFLWMRNGRAAVS